VVGFVGDDLAGRALEHELEDRGVQTSLSVLLGERTGTTLTADGDRRVDRGANALASPELLPDLSAAEIILVSGYLPRAAADAAISRVGRAAQWVAASAGVSGPPPRAPAVFLTQERARELTGRDAETSAMMLGRRHRLACVTRGGEGAVAALDGRVDVARPPHVHTGDATGAGDALAAATLVALAGGASLSDALTEGCRCGALVAASSGAWPNP
jgi:sugar/nucleoside kinase (ribokinase family)